MAVPVAPNRCSMVVRLIRVERVDDGSGRYRLEGEIVTSTPVEGPQFSVPGELAVLLSPAVFGPFSDGEELVGEFSFAGGPFGGTFQLLSRSTS